MMLSRPDDKLRDDAHQRTVQDTLIDGWARPVRYLRVSVTDRCNYACLYCMPEGGWKPSPKHELLSLEEIARLVELLAPHGLEKVRITGGEPLLRKDLTQLVGWVSQTPGIKTVAMTTNGHLLARFAHQLFEAGLRRLNVSLDTFECNEFKKLTGGGDLQTVLDGLAQARDAGFENIRINSVLNRSWSEDELWLFVTRCWREGWIPRFIELMPIGGLPFQTESLSVTSRTIWDSLEKNFVFEDTGRERDGVGGPAVYRTVAVGPFTGCSVGTISPMSDHGFCGTCNRIRLSARGGLRPCLANDEEVQILQLLRERASDEQILTTVKRALGEKLEAHRMLKPNFVPLSAMTGIGG